VDRYTIISSDTHAGGSHAAYREYLDPKYHEDFDAWRGKYKNPFKDLGDNRRYRNWDNEMRNSQQLADGVVGEVIFPNTVPPFFPGFVLFAGPPKPEDYEHRHAGIQAHNRWLADWCAGQPGRRAGIAQIFLNDLDDAIEDVQWAHEHGLRGGVLLPGVPDDMKHLKPLYSRDYDRLWAVCEELGVVINAHSGGSGLPDYGSEPAAAQVWISELSFFSRRPLVHLLLSGVFERFPQLRFVLTESGCSWIPETLRQLDGYHQQAKRTGRIGELNYETDAVLPLRPSEYFARNCWVGASFPSPAEAAARHDVGVDRVMWGSDYPHDESTYPDTILGLRRSLGDADESDLRALLGGNAAVVYGFDLDRLRPLAERFGPTVADVRVPYDGPPKGNRSPAFSKP
jgi:predicted TIM-barrel fold metal-dependent hydrolase